MNPFKNIIVNLQAAGTSAVASIWLICITLVALFAPVNSNTSAALVALLFFGGVLTTALSFPRRD